MSHRKSPKQPRDFTGVEGPDGRARKDQYSTVCGCSDGYEACLVINVMSAVTSRILIRTLAVAWIGSGAPVVAQRSASLPSDPARMVAMQHHFSDVSLVLEAVIRGDLGAIREPATRLAALKTPAGVPASSLQYVAAISAAGRRAIDVQTIQDAATTAASLARQCGECHLASSVRPVPVTVARP